MTQYYMQYDGSGRMFLGAKAPEKAENLIKIVEAKSWQEARDKQLAAPDLDRRYVKGFVYKQGHGYYKDYS